LDSSNAILIVKALDGLSARAVATAQNIANAGTPNYRPLRVTFEQALATAAGQGDEAVAAVSPQVQTVPPGARDSQLRLDMEMATATTTSTRYGALVEILNRQMQIQSLAITGND
jgi:flagellar basal-body rod protein FlgB